jgi:hypothetical protein
MTVRRYAEGTTVSVEKSKQEIERALTRYGADGFMAGWDAREAKATIMFRFRDKHVRIQLPLPKEADYKWPYGSTPKKKETFLEAATRQRWRALLLVVKAKLESVESKVATFEQEFLPYIVMPDGRTVGEIALPQIASAYESGRGGMRLLPGAVDGEVV